MTTLLCGEFLDAEGNVLWHSHSEFNKLLSEGDEEALHDSYAHYRDVVRESLERIEFVAENIPDMAANEKLDVQLFDEILAGVPFIDRYLERLKGNEP